MEKKIKLRPSEILSQQHTSLASPTEPTPKSNMTGAARNRTQPSLRKNGVSNGGDDSQHSIRSLYGSPSSTKGNGYNLDNLSSKSTQPQKMSMSPTAGMDQTVCVLVDWSDHVHLLHQSAVSESSPSAPTRASTHPPGKSRTNSLTPQSVRTKNPSGSAAGRDSLRNGQSQKHSYVKPGTQMVQWLRSTHMDRGLPQQAQISQRWESGRSISTNRFTNRFTNRQDVKTMKNRAQQSAEKLPEMTIKTAVKLLDKKNEKELISAAAYIQSQCFKKDVARFEVRWAHGAKKLVQLLKNDSEEVQRAAAAALRNVVYKDKGNKKEVTDENGLTIILNLLDKTHDKETVCQLAGVLWNLSSVDEIKDLFNENFLHVLTKVILVPFSHINGEAECKHDLIADPKAFLCATACLRNLSSDDNHRRNMRSCENLIDSLASCTTEAATKRTPDENLTENCVCILQNLTYEAEEDWIRQTTKNTEETQKNTTPKEMTCSCFPRRRANLEEDAKDKGEAEMMCLLQNNEDPLGVKWLWSGQLVRAYLSLLACSTNKMTLQATMGALQNLTVRKGEISESVARIIAEEKGPRKITAVLEKNITLKKPALLLMRNLSRFPELHPSIFDNLVATETTKSLLHLLDISAEESAELMPILCRILVNLSKNNVETAQRISRETAVNDMLQKKYEGKAKEAVEELRATLSPRSSHQHLEEVSPFTHHSDKTKNAKLLNLLPKSLQCQQRMLYRTAFVSDVRRGDGRDWCLHPHDFTDEEEEEEEEAAHR
ncbi:plakophilin-1-like [Poecilia formosa]|uniref:plakophilin-1-like n=1 Tax=Poecilia formosa TaxID=48698 RepID=UPI0004442A22|nr:PREDICTED: plakophilin-1-like [Poecilia formosa]